MTNNQKRVLVWALAIFAVLWFIGHVVIPFVSFVFHLVALPFEVLGSVIGVFIPWLIVVVPEGYSFLRHHHYFVPHVGAIWVFFY